jgi:hypothetical protein
VKERKGFVLAAALLALLVIAGLVAGAVFAANEGTRMATASAERQLTLAAAESSIEEAVARSDGGWWTMAIGATDASSQTGYGMPVAVYRTRLDTALFWILADAGPPRSGSGVMARVGVLVRADTIVGGGTSVNRIPERWWSELF